MQDFKPTMNLRWVNVHPVDGIPTPNGIVFYDGGVFKLQQQWVKGSYIIQSEVVGEKIEWRDIEVVEKEKEKKV